jgi:plasmid replication initiation protein
MDKIITKKAVQHNHLVNARFDLSTYEMRLFIAMLSHVNKNDQEFKECNIHITDFLDHSTGGKTYQMIKDACLNLSKKVIQIESIVENTKGKATRKFVMLPLMAMAVYQEGEATITAQFNAKLKPYLLNLAGNFTQAEIQQLIKLKSFNSYRLYWLLKQYHTFGERYIEVKELREMLNLQDKYERFQDFKMKVIHPAMKELSNTDMAFTYEQVKKGKTVEGIKFFFTSSSKVLPAAQSAQKSLFEQEQEVRPPATSLQPDGRVPLDITLAKFKLSALQISKIIKLVQPRDIYKTSFEIEVYIRDNKGVNPAAYAYKEFERRFFPKEKE